MKKWNFSELVNLEALQTMSDSLFATSGIPVGILDIEGNILVAAGWQDICTRYHRTHPISYCRCKESDAFILQHLNENTCVTYKCKNNLWDVAVPIVVEGEHIATLFVGQFFYDDEAIDIEYFKEQAEAFGFDIESYLDALKKVPRLSKDRVKHIVEYYKAFVKTLVESSIAHLQYKRTHEKLLMSEDKMKKLIKSMRDILFVIDEDGYFIEYFSPTDSMLYVKPEEFIGRKFDEILPAEPSELLKEAIEALNLCRIIKPFDYPLTIDKKVMWFSAQISKVDYEVNNSKEYYLIVVRDITERKNMEKELLKSKLEAEEANNAKNTFIANVSHELRTPVTVILSSIQLMEMKLSSTNPPGLIIDTKNITAMKKNCLRLLRLVNNLIDVTKIEAGFLKLNLKNLDIVSTVEALTNSVAEYAGLKDLQVHFSTNITKKVMAVDPDKFERILLNLLSNAIKFTEKQGSIFVSILDYETNIKISIRDTGIGIPENKTAVIFDRFHQIDNSLTRSHEGSGIGLSIVKSFIEMHSGTITVSSELGAGSEFTIILPVNIQNEPDLTRCDFENHSCNHYVDLLKIEFSDIYF